MIFYGYNENYKSNFELGKLNCDAILFEYNVEGLNIVL